MTDLSAEVLATVRDLHRRLDEREQNLDRKLDDKFGRVHTRLDEVSERLGNVERTTSLDIAELRHAQNSANIAVKTLADKVREEVLPETNDFKRMKMIGVGAVGLLALGGLSILGALAYAGEAAAAVIKKWLGLI